MRERTVDELTIDDERSFRHVAEYADLKAILARDRYLFRILPSRYEGRWDRALLLNLTYWEQLAGDTSARERPDPGRSSLPSSRGVAPPRRASHSR